YQVIQSTFDQLVHHSEQLEEKFGKTVEFRRQKLLFELLEGRGGHDRHLLEEQRRRIGWREENGPVALAVIEIDQYAAFVERFPDRDRHLFKLVLYKVLHELAAELRCSFWAEWIEDHR